MGALSNDFARVNLLLLALILILSVLRLHLQHHKLIRVVLALDETAVDAVLIAPVVDLAEFLKMRKNLLVVALDSNIVATVVVTSVHILIALLERNSCDLRKVILGDRHSGRDFLVGAGV
jgi:hypothetical protein